MLSKNAMVAYARRALHILRNDTVDIYVYEDIINPETGVVEEVRKQIGTQIPCSVSTSYVNPADEVHDGLATFSQANKLFLDIDVIIPVGAEFIVTHDGNPLRFIGAGIPVRYATHQEIAVKRGEKYGE